MIRTLLVTLLVFVGTSELGSQSQPSHRDSTQPKREAVEVHVEGAGATTINPLLSAWIAEYTRLHPNIRVSYRPIGSGGGIRLLNSEKINFAAVDRLMPDDQIGHGIEGFLCLPVALHDVVPIYNLGQVTQLKFSGTTLADIFLGKITMWNDPAIRDDNPGLVLPQISIKVVHQFPRPNSPAGYVMAEYLSKVSPEFKAAFANSSGAWPLADIRYKGSEGAPSFVSHTPGSLAYAETDFAHQDGLAFGAVKNAAGEFVTPSHESLTAAAASAISFVQSGTGNFRLSISNASGKSAFPIVSFTYLLVRRDASVNTNKALMDFVKWTLTDGQKLAAKLGYLSLPDDLLEAELKHVE